MTSALLKLVSICIQLHTYHIDNNISTAQEHSALIEWLSPLDFLIRQSDIFARHVDGTGSWFLGLEEFIDWRDSDASILWCEGGRESSMILLVTHYL